jgi:Uma2 family endonuclease
MQQAQHLPILIKDYLKGELESDIRHEFYDGNVYAMAGAGRKHNTIALNIASILREGSRGSDCRSFIADMKLFIADLNRFYYPDIVLAFESDDNHELYIEKPCLIVEVLSPSTEAIDRREKLHAYQAITSLKEYVMVSQEEQKVELYRCDGKYWQYFLLDENDTLHLECLSLDIRMADVYEDVFS